MPACRAMGFSVNLLTLFGLILAIGVVVDNAIIIMENAERLIKEEGMSPYNAAVRRLARYPGPWWRPRWCWWRCLHRLRS